MLGYSHLGRVCFLPRREVGSAFELNVFDEDKEAAMLYIDIFTPKHSTGFKVFYDDLKAAAEESAAEEFCGLTKAEVDAIIDRWLPE